ncbi:MAG: hypothetical protein ACK415_11000 [Thermodesulfovibrionales bacterium]
MSTCERGFSWLDRDRNNAVSSYIEGVFSLYPEVLKRANDIARIIKVKIEGIDQFIQQNTSEVCPSCKNKCCINRHGYYDNLDILYIMALGMKPPLYQQELSDTEPCRFLSDNGCVKERYLRPFRCNWYFCEALLNHMEEGPARPYREFIRVFNEILDLRSELLNCVSKYCNKHTARPCAI